MIYGCDVTSGNPNADLHEILLDSIRGILHNFTNPKVLHENTFKSQYVAACGGPSQLFIDFIGTNI